MSAKEYQIPFLDYYNKNNCMPVEQDISNLAKHFSRRDSLYRSLGIVPGAIEGKNILELGPGSGHNSIHTRSHNPKKYVLVDGSSISLKLSKDNISQYFENDDTCEYVESYFETFNYPQKFDYVFCEGVIPGQIAPEKFLKKIAGNVKPGGVLVVTCVDSTSALSEVTRRLVARLLLKDQDVYESAKVNYLLPFFENSIATLEGMSRKPSDWIKDVLLNPLHGALFGLDSAVESINEDFEIYSSSPNFLQDWRWYKDIYLEQKNINANAVKSYKTNILNFLDYRDTFTAIDLDTSNKIKSLSDRILGSYIEFQFNQTKINLVEEIITNLHEISLIIKDVSGQTSDAIQLHCTTIEQLYLHGVMAEDSKFKKCDWFGRGQQYVSFIRNDDSSPLINM
jgi:ubiquinone/menaquinone biosynthesis C-methylase UbiE